MAIVYILIGIGVLALGTIIAYYMVMSLADHYKNTRHNWYLLDMHRDQLRVSRARTLYPNEAGDLPLLWDGQTLLDVARGLVFSFRGLEASTPEVAKPEQLTRMLRAGGGWPVGAAAEHLLPSPEPVHWPGEIPLKSVVAEPDITSLVLGVTVDAGGQHVIKANMSKLVHVGVGGSSGFGKSVFLRSLAYQLALSQAPVDLAMVDLEGATLAPFASCGRLLYPIADTERDALTIFRALLDEMDRRKDLYSDYPGADSLRAYNAQADERLTPLVCLVDEATALLGDKSAESALRTLALRARKYGLWLVLAGQDWKASSLDTAIRNQLSSRVQFKAMSASQSRVLLQQNGAEDLETPGRALAILPGSPLFELQVPYVSSKTILQDVSDGGARYPMPDSDGDDLEERIRALWADGCGLGEISEKIYGYKSGKRTAQIKEILGLF